MIILGVAISVPVRIPASFGVHLAMDDIFLTCSVAVDAYGEVRKISERIIGDTVGIARDEPLPCQGAIERRLIVDNFPLGFKKLVAES